MEEIIEQGICTLSLAVNNYTVREEMMDGKKHLVVPVVMMVEGVHSGSKGPILHRGVELEKWTEAWNGIPVTISHPNVEGANVSANSPEVLDMSAVGRIFNTTYADGLKAEAWIDWEKISTKSEEALEALLGQEPLEVSVGVFNDSDYTEGEWNGETYNSIAYNYRPDHLALLPGEKGACSWTDGCGIRTNKEGGNEVKDLQKTFSELSQRGYVVSLLTNEMGYREIQDALREQLSALNRDGVYHYIEEVFDEYIIYSEWVEDGGGETLYKQGYSIDDNENVVFEGGTFEVKKKVEYVTNKMRRTKQVNNNQNEGGKMSTTEKTPCCLAKIEKLIANELTSFSEADREWLMTQEESNLDKMFPKEAAKPVETPAPQVNKQEVVDEFKGSLKTIEDYTAIMPSEMKVQIEGGVKLYTEHREALVKSILDNTAEGIWEEDALKAMDDKTLENLSKSIKQPADYSGQAAGGGTVPASGEQVELPVEYSERKEEK